MLRLRVCAMALRFADGDWVWVDSDEPAVDGRYVAVWDPETEGQRRALPGGGRSAYSADVGCGRAGARQRSLFWREHQKKGTYLIEMQ